MLIFSPPAKPNRKPFLPVLGCLYPKEVGGRVEGEGALEQLLWPRPRGNALELTVSGLVGGTLRGERLRPWARPERAAGQRGEGCSFSDQNYPLNRIQPETERWSLQR